MNPNRRERRLQYLTVAIHLRPPAPAFGTGRAVHPLRVELALGDVDLLAADVHLHGRGEQAPHLGQRPDGAEIAPVRGVQL